MTNQEIREKIAEIIYQNKDSFYIIQKTEWKDLADFNKKDYLEIADKIFGEITKHNWESAFK